MLRRIGIGALGLLAGLLLGLVVHDVLARVLQAQSAGSMLGSVLPLFAVAGAVVALLADRRRSKQTDETDV